MTSYNYPTDLSVYQTRDEFFHLYLQTVTPDKQTDGNRTDRQKHLPTFLGLNKIRIGVKINQEFLKVKKNKKVKNCKNGKTRKHDFFTAEETDIKETAIEQTINLTNKQTNTQTRPELNDKIPPNIKINVYNSDI